MKQRVFFVLLCVYIFSTFSLFSDTVTDVLRKYANNPKGWSALNYAIEQRDYDAAKILIDYVGDFNKMDNGTGPLGRLLNNAWRSSSKKLTDIERDFAYLLLQKRVKVSFKHDSGQNLLYLALSLNETGLVSTLLEKGANVQEDYSRTFFFAVEHSSYDIVKLFLERGADVNGESGRALQYALNTLNYDLAELLIEHGADVNANNCLPLSTAVRKLDYDIVKLLIENGAKVDGNNGGPLHLAVSQSNYDLANLLINSGAKVDRIGGESGFHHLYSAVNNNDVKMVRLLLENNASPNFCIFIIRPRNKCVGFLSYVLSKSPDLFNDDSKEIIALLLQSGAKL